MIAPFAPVALATLEASPFALFVVHLPALFGVVLAAQSVLVSSRFQLAFAATFSWLVTIVFAPQKKVLSKQLLDSWWAASLALVVILSLFPQTNEPRLTSSIAVAHSPADEALLVHLRSVSGSPWGCTHRSVHAFAVFRSNRISTKEGKFGEWAHVNVASIPHEEYMPLQLYNPENTTTSSTAYRLPAVYKLNYVMDRDLVIKVGIRCANFPADLLFGNELWMLDSGSSELHRFVSPDPITPPKPPLIPRPIITLLNPFAWPSAALHLLRTYTTLIELGIVWPLLTRVLRRVLIHHRQDRIAAGKRVVNLENEGEVRVETVFEGIGELFVALAALFGAAKKVKKNAALDAGAIELPASAMKMIAEGKRPRVVGSAGEEVASTAASKPHAIETSAAVPPESKEEIAESEAQQQQEQQQQLSHNRAASSPITTDNYYYTSNMYKPISKLTKSPSLWDDSSTPSRFVGSLITSVVTNGLRAAGAGGRRRRRWEIPGYVFIVIKSYEPAFKDELSISIGNLIRIKKIFDDGWALGLNQSTNMQGILPMAFLTCINPTSPSAPPIDPQQFIPRGTTTPPTGTSTPTTTTFIPEEIQDSILPFTDLPPQHLRVRGRSVTKSNSMSDAVITPVAPPPASGGETPRGRSSSLHRNARGTSTKRNVVSKSNSTISLKTGPPTATRHTGVGERTRKGSAVSEFRGRIGAREAGGVVVQVVPGGNGTDEDEEERDEFEDAVVIPEVDDGSVTLMYGVGEEEEEVEEVVIVEEEEEEDETSGVSQVSDEDRDVWPPVRLAVDRKGSVALGGYSFA
ncbi:hypothetical protein HDU98_002429 [Podochytrium sp. JEL0797]|nr:hypothetical protein HDU98_002429 [Podochytrium sp. JEL0797]